MQETGEEKEKDEENQGIYASVHKTNFATVNSLNSEHMEQFLEEMKENKEISNTSNLIKNESEEIFKEVIAIWEK